MVFRAIRCAPLLTALVAMPALADPCPRLPADGPMVEAALDRSAPVTIVALGSSSTEGAGASSPSHAYPARLEALLRQALPGREVRVINAGRSGETAEETLARLDRDVLAHHPTLVLWQAGGNEALRGRDPEGFERVMRDGLARLSTAGVPVVLMDNQRSPRITETGGRRFDAVLARLATPFGIGLFTRGAWQAAAQNPGALVAPDGLHFNDAGYACLASALAEQLLPALAPPVTVARR